ncbi:efflux RND transporter periplasmic adaptor subunit [Rhodoblastus acidophilus]|uniref:Efflux RND transporter periplasmic adaptor subunit n=1 Tax=Rhodoblastus acidophilus TaxID=1074 RepID=A0A6N8DKN6_RHOAC|nr:efflux RND transporter periplasmic adaptor subunit [Rhodoblastus acidophilus]MCW2274409.1 multidrug efflux system membrane fusion protein [Rhodoblastus acidophilus]MTV31140.1 efflux RND transporter periplasmic adaptor subunit [Rhodoblastus acidophilus]
MTTEDLEHFASERQAPAGRIAAPPVAPTRTRGRLRTILVWIAVLAALGLGARFLWTRNIEVATPVAQLKKSDRGGPQPVGVATIGRRDVHVILNALGTVTPLATVTVVSQISGVLQDVGFVEGQKVKKGDFLAQIDDRPYRAQKAQYEGQLARDQGFLAQAKADEERYQRLLKQNSIASQTADNQKFVVKQYEGTVAADQALVDAQALNIAYARITSPVDGRVGLRLVDPGNYVTAGTASSSSSSAGIVVVTQLQPISVLYSIPEDSLRRVAPQLLAGKTLETDVYDRTNTRLLAKGETRAIDNQVDATTGMVKLRAYFDNKDNTLFPNQFVNVRLLANTIPQALAAPISGIQHGAPGDYAWVVSPEGKVSVQKVKLGQTDGDIVQILEGLNEGDRIVVDGSDRLREGGEARVVMTDGVSAPVEGDAKASEAKASGEERRKKRKDGAAPPTTN